jgi:DNA polymerase I-like protein with 3'-5' exonuclease and polymerase domains/uracil-DNA glycosylase
MSVYRTSKLVVPPDWNGVLIVGDCPYKEDATASPFMHSHLGTIKVLMGKGGWDQFRSPAFANISGKFPKNGLLSNLHEQELALEVKEFAQLVEELKPRVLIGLGRQAARYVKPGSGDLDDERGAPFKTPWGVGLLSYHPREIFRQYEHNIVAIADFTKANKLIRQGWQEPVWNINYRPTFQDVVTLLHRFLETRCPLGCDIETNYHLKATCIGLAYNRDSAIVIPFVTPQGPYWTEHEEKVVWKLLAQVLERNPLIGQHAVHFDHYILARGHKILANFVADTEFAHWEIYCEMPKSLAFINSLYLLNPYWKSVLKEARSGKRHFSEEWLYCGQDCCVTMQGAQEIKKEFVNLPAKSYEHYKFNIRVSRAFQYMAIHGCQFDIAKRDARLTELRNEETQLQLELNAQAGKTVMVTSPQKMKKWLYEELKLPIRYVEKRTEEGDVEMRETQDYLTLLLLGREFPNIPAILTAGRLRKLKKRLSSLSAITCRPGTSTIGWNFNVVGTETGRASGYKPADGWGVQPQNVDARDRDLFVSGDADFWCKADLEGADAWTVAAMLSALGDNTMLDDLLAGVKPAQALTIAVLFGQHLVSAPAAQLKSYMPEFKAAIKLQESTRGKKRSDYDAMKAVSHGSNYCMGPQLVHETMFKKSNGELYVPVTTCRDYQALYEKRYKGLFKLRERMSALLASHGYLDAYSGNRRYFYGRRDNSTVRAMISQLPQAHTTYATNLLLDRLYHWRANRLDASLRLLHRPINQVHDETNTLFPRSELDRARDVFQRASVNRITCWGVDFTIPFEVNYGVSWGECDEELL